MDIVPIIYKFLIIGGSLLTFIILVSFLLSKTNKRKEPVEEKYLAPQPMYINHNSPQGHLVEQRPVIIPITAFENREINVVRRQSYEELDMSNRTTTGGGKNTSRRYTILNEELKNTNYRYVNEG